MLPLLVIGLIFVQTLSTVEAEKVCNAWDSAGPCNHIDNKCIQPAVRSCQNDNGDVTWDEGSVKCALIDCEYENNNEESDDEAGSESSDEESDNGGNDSSAGQDGPDELRMLAAPAELNTGEEFCISACGDEYSFLKTYQTGLPLNQNPLCRTNITEVIGGRGGEGCRADDWFIVDQCNEDCYEFGWRASYPTYCDVEDIWLWCCAPKAEASGRTVGGEFDTADIPCVVTAYRNTLEYIYVTWRDADGNDLSNVEGYEVSRIYKVQDDKILSVLSVDSSAISNGLEGITCEVSIEGDHDVATTDQTSCRKFSVEVTQRYQRVGSDAELSCTALGTAGDDGHYTFNWYYLNQDGEKVFASGEEGFGQFEIRDSNDNWASVLTIPPENQVIGSQYYQCEVEFSETDSCGLVHTASDSKPTVLIVWDVTDDTYCAHPGDEAVLTFTILGSENVPSVDDGIIESITKGTIVTTQTTPREGFLMTFSRNEDNELVVFLTISPNMTLDAGSEFFITYTGAEGKEGVLPNLELNIMELQMARGEETAEGEQNPDNYVVVSSVDGGYMENPVWIDNNGKIYRLGTNEDGVEVTLSDDKTETTITLPNEVVDGSDITLVSVTARLFSDQGTYCRRQRESITIGLTTSEECRIVWSDAVCDNRLSCNDYVQERDWSCECSVAGGPWEDSDKSKCEAPAEERLSFTCPATAQYQVTPWDEPPCDRTECYPYPLQRERTCYCQDADGAHTDNTGILCDHAELVDIFYCPATKDWILGGWNLGECPAESCNPTTTRDTRGCFCDGTNDRSKCAGDVMERERICPANREYQWSDWSPETCDLEDRCYDTVNTRIRACVCQNYDQKLYDNTKCPGDSELQYSCEANLQWIAEPAGDPCYEADTVSCEPFTATQQYRCVCEHGNDREVDGDLDLCGAQPSEVRCPANKPFEWSEWEPTSDCSLCYPELDRAYSRSCTCGNQEPDSTRCDGPEEKSEACPAPRVRVWLPTEWNEIPCGDLSCSSESFTTRTRDCECDGNKDNSRCSEELTDIASCGFAPFILSEWSDVNCDRRVCEPYTLNRTRSCVCEDGANFFVEDTDQCDAGEEGYTQEFQCEGDSYEWGEWQSRGCPENSCFSTKTKRYRICSCHGDVDFNQCGSENAIEFYDCPISDGC